MLIVLVVFSQFFLGVREAGKINWLKKRIRGLRERRDSGPFESGLSDEDMADAEADLSSLPPP